MRKALIAIAVVVIILVVAGAAFLFELFPLGLENDSNFLKIKSTLADNGYTFKSLYDLNVTLTTDTEPLEGIESGLESLEFTGSNSEKVSSINSYFLQLTRLRLRDANLMQKINQYTVDEELLCDFAFEIIETSVEFDSIEIEIESLNDLKEQLVQDPELEELGIFQDLDEETISFASSQFELFSDYVFFSCSVVSSSYEVLEE